MEKKDYQFIVTTSQLFTWHQLVDNPSYVKEAINKGYWDAYKKLHPDPPPPPPPKPDEKDNFLLYLIIGIAGGVVLIAVTVVIIICIKKRGSSEDNLVDS